MDDAHDGPYAREPQIQDLTRICRALNDAGARYLLIGGVDIPVASLQTLIRTKNTMRPSDAADRLFLEELLKATRGER